MTPALDQPDRPLSVLEPPRASDGDEIEDLGPEDYVASTARMGTTYHRLDVPSGRVPPGALPSERCAKALGNG